jgi:hypothetical protein
LQRIDAQGSSCCDLNWNRRAPPEVNRGGLSERRPSPPRSHCRC